MEELPKYQVSYGTSIKQYIKKNLQEKQAHILGFLRSLFPFVKPF